jgi:hypothetical protein
VNVLQEACKDIMVDDEGNKYRMPYPNMKVLVLEGPVEKECLEQMMKEAKTPNQTILAELHQIARDLISKAFASEVNNKVSIFRKVQESLSLGLMAFGSPRALADQIKSNGIDFTRIEATVALNAARSLGTEYRFTKEEFVVLAMLGITGNNKKTVDVSERTKSLIHDIQNDIPVEDITAEDAKNILAAARSNREKYGVNGRVYSTLISISKAG